MTESEGTNAKDDDLNQETESEQKEKEYKIEIQLPFEGNTYKISFATNAKVSCNQIMQTAHTKLTESSHLVLGSDWIQRSSLYLAKDDDQTGDDRESSRRSSVSSTTSTLSQSSTDSQMSKSAARGKRSSLLSKNNSQRSGLFGRKKGSRKNRSKPKGPTEIQFQTNQTLEQFIQSVPDERRGDILKLEWKCPPIDIVVGAVYNGELKEHTFEWDKYSEKRVNDLFSALNIGDTSSIPKEMKNGLWFVESAQRYTDAPYAVIKAVAANSKSKDNGGADTALDPSIPSDSQDDDALNPPEDNSKSNDTYITFDASGSRDRENKECKHFIWDFGDGTDPKPTTTSTIVHPFENHGIYSVNCTVIDAEGNMSICSMQQVIGGQKDIESISVRSSVFEAVPNEMVIFYASGQKTDELQYRWYFGDGTTKTSDIPRIAHIFEETGSYSVRVEVSEKIQQNNKTRRVLKRSATLQQKVCSVNPDRPSAVIAVVSQSEDEAKSEPKGQMAEMKENDGDIQEEEEQKYPQKDDADGVNIASMNTNEPETVIESKDSMSNDGAVSVTFDASKSVDKKGAECTRFGFDFGDGSDTKESENSKVTHQYTSEGTYLVTVVVMDSDGNRSSASLTHKIERVKESKESDGGKSKKKRKQRNNRQKEHEDEEDPNGSEDPSTEKGVESTNSKEDGGNQKKKKFGRKNKQQNADDEPKQDLKGNENQSRPTLQSLISPQIDYFRPLSVVNQTISFSVFEDEEISNRSKALYQWDFGDGTTCKPSKDPKYEHSYSEPGSYSITVLILDKNQQDIDRCPRAVCTHRVLAEMPQIDKDPHIELHLCIPKVDESPDDDDDNKNQDGADTPNKDSIEDSNRAKIAKVDDEVSFLCKCRNYKNTETRALYIFDFGDESPPAVCRNLNESKVKHKFEKIGTYQVSVTTIDADGRGGYATISVLVNDPNDVGKRRNPQVFVKTEQKEEDEPYTVSFDVSESMNRKGKSLVKFTFDFGDGNEPETFENEKIENIKQKWKIPHKYDKPGTYHVTVIGQSHNGKTAKARMSVRVLGGDESRDEEQDDELEANPIIPVPSVSKMRMKESGDFNPKDLREKQFDESKSLSEFVDYLKGMDIALGRRLYLEWRPKINDVVIDLSFNGQLTQWKCSWADIAEWKCQDILQITENLYIGPQGAIKSETVNTNGVEEERGTASLWLAESKQDDDGHKVKKQTETRWNGLLGMGAIAEDQEDETKTRHREFPSGKTLNQFICSIPGDEIQNGLHLKMRHIPSKILIDLSSLKAGIEVPFQWNGSKGIKDKNQKEILNLLRSDKKYKSSNGHLLDKHLKVWLQLKYEESSLDPQEAPSPEPSDAEDDGKDDEKHDIKPKEKSVEWADSETMEDVALKLIDNGNSLGNTLHLELRHNLEDIKIAVSHGKLNGELSFKWGQIADKDCGAILDDIQKELKQVNDGGDVPGKERAVLWFKPKYVAKGTTATDIGPIQFTRYRLLDFVSNDIRQILEKQKRSLQDLNGLLNLEWRCPPAEIVLTALYDGELKEQRVEWSKYSEKKHDDLFKIVQNKSSIPDLKDGRLCFVESAQRHADAPYAIIKAVNCNIKLDAVEKSQNEHSQHTTITFDASGSRDRYGQKCRHFTWDFGDGTEPEKGPTVEHTFKELGIYSVKCTVIDSERNMAMCSMQQEISRNKKNIRSLSVKSSAFEVAPNQMVNFYASDLKIDGLQYVWYFGDGNSVRTTDPRISHIFNEAGSYSVRVEVSEPSDNGQRTLKRTATLRQRVCSANSNRPATVITIDTDSKEQKHDEPDGSISVTFDASASMDKKGVRCKRFWFDFGDGSDIKESENPIAIHRYTAEETYLVTVIAEDKDGNRGTASLTHKIEKVKNEEKDDGGNSRWNFMSKFGNTEQKHDDSEEDANGVGSDSKDELKSSRSSQIESFRPFSAVHQSVSFRVFDGESSTRRPKKPFQWDFGDGEELKTSETPTIEYTYKQPGSYTITLIITDKNKTEISRSVCTHYVLPESDSDPHIELHVEDTKEEDVSHIQEEPTKESNPKDEQNPKDEEDVKENAADAAERKIKENRQKLAKKGETVSFSCTIRNSESAERPSRTILIFDFGDDGPLEICESELATTNVEHEFEKMGTYQVTVTAIDANGRGGYATISVLVLGDDAEEAKKKREPQVFIKAEQIAEDSSLVKFDVSGSMTREGKPLVRFSYDFGDKNQTTKDTDKEDIEFDFKEPGIYCVAVTGETYHGKKAMARMRLRVIGQKMTENEKVDVIEPKQSRWISKTTNQKPSDLKDQDLKLIRFDDKLNVRQFVDHLKEMNVSVDKHMYLEWRPPISDVLLDLSFDGQSLPWRCCWNDIAKWKCKEILEMTERIEATEKAGNNDVDAEDHITEPGAATLWLVEFERKAIDHEDGAKSGIGDDEKDDDDEESDEDDESDDDDDESDDDHDERQFPEEQTMEQFTREIQGNGGAAKAKLLHLKMRYIPSEIVIDLSSLKTSKVTAEEHENVEKEQAKTMITLPWVGSNHLKDIVKQLGKNKEYKSIRHELMEEHFQIFFESSEEEKYVNEQKEDLLTSELGNVEFPYWMKMQQFTLYLIDQGFKIGNQLRLKWRHNLEDIKITVSYGKWFNSEDVSLKWCDIVDMDCGAILDDIASTLKKEKSDADIPGNEGAALWFNGEWFGEMHIDESDYSDSDDSDYSDYDYRPSDMKCKSEWKLIRFIEELIKSDCLYLEEFKGPLHLEWRQLISGIKVNMSYRGHYLPAKYDMSIIPIYPWKDKVKKWTADDNPLKNQIMERENLYDALEHILRLKTELKTTDPENGQINTQIEWKEWTDGSKLEQFVSKLQEEGVRLEGDLVLLWKHLPKKVVVDLPYFGTDLSFVWESAKDKKIKKKGWRGVEGMTHSDFMDKVQKHADFQKLELPPNFDAQLWWVWNSNQAIVRSDDRVDDEENDSPNEEAHSISRICCTIRVEGNEFESKTLDPSEFGADQTGASIISWILERVESHSEDAYSRLYFDGNSLETMVTFPPEMTVNDFVETVKVATGNDDSKYDEPQYDEEHPLKLVYVEYNELPFGVDDGKSKGSQRKGAKKGEEKESTLYGLIQTLESKGIDFEEGELQLEWRPSVTSIEVAVLYNGERETINISWPKRQKTECHSIMDIIRDKDEYKELKIPDKNIGLPMLWFVAADKVKKQNARPDTEPHPESKSELEEKYEHEAEDGGRFGMDRFKMDRFNVDRFNIDRFNMDRFNNNNWFGASGDTASGDDQSKEKDPKYLRFREDWALHSLIAAAYNQKLPIHDHIHLEWRFVPKTVVVQVPFEDGRLSFKHTVYEHNAGNETQDTQRWTDVSNKTCDDIKKEVDAGDKFKDLKSQILANCSWDLWYIVPSDGLELQSPDQMYEDKSTLSTLSAEPFVSGITTDDEEDANDRMEPSQSTKVMDSVPSQPQSPTVMSRETSDQSTMGHEEEEANGGGESEQVNAIKFDSDMNLEQFVLMLREKGFEPGDELVLEYRRVPGEITVDLSYFDVDAKYPTTDGKSSDYDMDWPFFDEVPKRQSKLSMDLKFDDLMNEVKADLIKRYGVPKADCGAFLYLDKTCILEKKDVKRVREVLGKEVVEEKKKKKAQEKKKKSETKNKKNKKSKKGTAIKGKKGQKARGKVKGTGKVKGMGKRRKKQKTSGKKAKDSALQPVPEEEETKPQRKEWEVLKFEVDNNSNPSIREFVESLRESGIELRSNMILKWNHNIPEKDKLKVQFELINPLNDLQSKCTEPLTVHRFQTNRKLIQTLRAAKYYKEWEGSPPNRDDDDLSTLYFNSETAGSKASKMMIFERQQTLNDFFNELEEGMVATGDLGKKEVLTLQYLEGMLFR